MKKSPDIVLMDIKMPVLDGYEATKTIREKGFSGPIIMTSAYSFETEKLACKKVGCNGYLTKPVDFTELCKLIHRQIKGDLECKDNFPV